MLKVQKTKEQKNLFQIVTRFLSKQLPRSVGMGGLFEMDSFRFRLK